jgi:hypothetical protein
MIFQIGVLLDFQPSYESGRTTQHGHTKTKLRGEPTGIKKTGI